MAEIEKRTTPHSIEIVFDQETMKFKGAFFIGIEQVYVDGEKLGSPSQTHAIPLEKVLTNRKGEFTGYDLTEVTKLLGDFNTRIADQLVERTAEVAEANAAKEQIVKEKADLNNAIASLTRDYDTHIVNLESGQAGLRASWDQERAQLIQAARDLEAARNEAAQELADYRQADRVSEILKTREPA